MRNRSKAAQDGLGSVGPSEIATIVNAETSGPPENVPNQSRCFILGMVFLFLMVNVLSFDKKFGYLFLINKYPVGTYSALGRGPDA